MYLSLIQRFIKKVVVYNNKLEIYLIAGIDTIDSNDDNKQEVLINNNSNDKSHVGNGCLILECGR